MSAPVLARSFACVELHCAATPCASVLWRRAGRVVLSVAAVLLVACGTGGKPKKKPPAPGLMTPIAADYFIPADAFDANGLRTPSAVAAPRPQAAGAPAPFVAEVQVYFSKNSATYFRKGGLDGSLNVVLWERFLRKYDFPHRLIEDVDALEAAAPGVLVLPSNVALSERELQAVAAYRGRGGSVFASWLAGTRGEDGAWRGFDRMEALLGIRVQGFTGPHEEDRYLNPAGDSIVGHSLPACQRIWTERVVGWYPLRVEGAHAGAQWHNWSRTLPVAKPNTALLYDESALNDGAASRMVYFAWPERLWMGADPRRHEALLFDAITWLLRQPAAYLGNWPHPYRSAYVPIVYMADVFNHNDLPFAESMREQGLQATYFLLSHEIGKSAPTLAEIAAMGHRFGYEADEYEGFRDQPFQTQAQRLDTMREEIAAEDVSIEPDAGFNAPMDDEDANTRLAVAQRPFDYMIASTNGTDACLPYFAEQAAEVERAKPLVMLPRTHRGAEEMLEEYDEVEAVASQLAELDSVVALGGLSIVRFANQSLLSSEVLTELATAPAARTSSMWTASAEQLVRWWRQRARVGVELSGTAAETELQVSIDGETAVEGPLVVWLTMPRPGAVVDAMPIGAAPPLAIHPYDPLRVAISLDGLAPGRYSWRLDFRGP